MCKYFVFPKYNTMASMGDMSLQEKMRLGETVDIYYYNSKTLEKNAIPALQDTRFFQVFPSMGAGSSTFIYSPDQGVQDIIVGLKLPVRTDATGAASYNGLAVPKAWGYQLINRISVRYAGSSQYFWTGEQVFVENMRECSNPTSKESLVQLGGAELKTVADFAGDQLYAYIPLNLPHSSTNASLEKPNPLPTELLSQPIVITVELNPISSIFYSAAGVANAGVAPTMLEDAWFQVRQIHALDGGQLMRPMGNGAGYSYALKAFYQNQIDVPLQQTTSVQSVTLTGFRAGQVRSIFFWIEDTSDPKNKFVWTMPRDVQLQYNGLVYQNYRGTSSQIWDLLGTDVPSNYAGSRLTDLGSGQGWDSEDVLVNWINLPFSMIYEQLSASSLYVTGKSIENAVVNLQLATPQAKSTYVLKAVYAYNSLLFMSAGSAEYLF
jgi:hypothetical protein